MTSAVTMFVLGTVSFAFSQTASDGDSTQVRFDGHRVIRAWPQTDAEIEAIIQMSPDIWSHSVGMDGSFDFRLLPDDMEQLKATGIQHQVMIDDVQFLIEAEQARLSGQDDNGGIADNNWYLDFKQYDEIVTYLNNLATQYPDLSTIFEVGTSVEGRTIWGIRISSQGGAADKPGVLLNGCQHAREWITPMSTMYTAEHLLSEYGSDPAVTAVVDNLEFFVIPVVNADGYVYTWTTNRMWRKNRSDNGGGKYGVDLNRNWGYEWGGVGSSSNPGSDLYRGAGPFSEPETAALRDLILDHPNIISHVDIHSYGQLVLYPWCYTGAHVADYDTFDSIANDIADAIYSVHGFTYEPGQWYADLYPSSGTMIDWCYGDRSQISYNIELRDRGQFGFILPASQILPTGEELFAGIVELGSAQFDLGMVLDTSILERGEAAHLRAGRATPNSYVYFVYSITGTGQTWVSQLGVTLDLDQPALAGRSQVGADGIAVYSDLIPSDIHPYLIWLQSAENGRTSNVVFTQLY